MWTTLPSSMTARLPGRKARWSGEEMSPAGLQDAGSFAEGFVQARHVLKNIRRNDQVERVVLEFERGDVLANCARSPLPG